jgi:hypothetical protein
LKLLNKKTPASSRRPALFCLFIIPARQRRSRKERSMHGSIVPTSAGQGAPTPLGELATAIREAHTGVTAAVSSVVKYALAAGRAAIVAQGMVPKGQWEHWLQKTCDVCPRHVRRYMALSRVYEAGGHSVSEDELVGLSLRGAIKKLTPPKTKPAGHTSQPAARSERSKPKQPAGRRRTHIDILAIWDEAPPEERVKAIDSIGCARRSPYR